MSKTEWTKDQKQAITKSNANILVSASAGSGKTAVLVERIIQKVINEYLDIDKILVVTFTNAAAQELKEKILNAIYKALETEKDIKKINHLRNQLIYINRASITTIDAFCLKLVKENFDKLNIDPNIRICEESQSNLIKSKVLEELLENEYEKYSNEKDTFGLYNLLELFNGSDDVLLNNIIRIYNYIQSFPYPFIWLKEQIEKYNISENVDLCQTDFGEDIYLDAVDEIRLCIVKYGDYLSKIEGIEEFNKCATILNDDVYMLKSCINIENDNWDKLYENLESVEFAKFAIGKVSNIELKEEIAEFRKTEVKDVILKVKKKIYAKSSDILQDNSIAYEYIKYLYELLLSFDKRFKEEKIQSGVAEFNDIMHYALELLVDEKDEITDIANSIKKRYKEIYTDEYQDTSYVQERILQAVATDNNRFMVGDIKQSIYGFRQARPDIFNDKYISYKKEEEDTEDIKNCKIILSQNFRSRSEVLNSINYIFEKIMSMKNGQCNYTYDESLKCGNTSYPNVDGCDYTTQINIIDLKQEEKNYIEDNEENDEYEIDEDLTSFEIESKCIAFKIQDIVNNMKITKKDGTTRNATYKDIVILLRGIKGKAEVLEKVLKDNDIPVFCDTSSSIFDGDEVKLILSFLRVLDNPYQDVYITSIMYSIIGNFTLDELTKIRLYDNKSYVYDVLNNIALDEEFKKKEEIIYTKVTEFLALLKEYSNYSKVYSISDLIIRLYKDTNIYYQLALEENSTSKRANLDYLIELANNFYTNNIGNTLNSYIKYIDNLKNKQDSSGSAKIIGENEDVVRVMTIHKSKGLEFPIVILADCSKNYNFKDLRSEKVLLHHKYGIGIDVVNQDISITYPSLIKQAIKSVIEKETKSEELRLLYVALTRAKEKLYIFATTKDYKKDYDMQLLNIKDNKFNETLIASNNSYYKNLLPVIKLYCEFEKDKNILDVQHLEITSNTTDENLKKMLSVSNISNVKKSVNEVIDEIKKNTNVVANDEILKNIEDKIEYDYKYKDDVIAPLRVSVSNLKKNNEESEANITSKIEDETKDIDDESQESTKFRLPYELDENANRYTAVRKGILVHFILQNLEFEKLNSQSDIKEYIEKLVFKGIISQNDKKYININRIYNFLNSNIGKELKNAKKIYREYEFILNKKEISNSTIQGIIDLFYVTDNDKVVLVDFKTDRIENDSDFIKKYKVQLEIYKEAINTLTEYKVDKIYIYSFNLNKEIEIVEE